MSPPTAPAPRTGSLLPAGARSTVRGAARAVVATVGAVLAGLVLALPAVHLPITAAPAGLRAAVVSSVDHRPTSFTAAPVPGTGPATHAVVRPVALAAPAVVQVLAAPGSVRAAAPAAALAADLASGAPWVLLAAALLAAALAGVSRPPARRRVPVRAPHLGPAPLRGPPAGLAPAP